MSDDKESDEIYHKSKNDEERVAGDKEVFKLGKSISKENDNNIEKEYDERNRVDMRRSIYLWPLGLICVFGPLTIFREVQK